MEELHLGNLCPPAHVFPQEVGTLFNHRNVFAVPEGRFRISKITLDAHLLNVLLRICSQSGWNHLAILQNLYQEASLN